MQASELSKRSQREMQHYYKTGTADTRYSFELFRRALAERDERAWASVIDLYHGMVKRWVLNHSKFESSGEEADYFVNRAFERLWRYVACKPGKFAQFSELPAVLQYLKLCAHASVTDDAPSLSVSTLPMEADNNCANASSGTQGSGLYGSVGYAAEFHSAAADTESADLEQTIEQNELWQTIEQYLTDETERIVLFGFFIEGLKNRELLELYPDHFEDAKQISNKRTAILRRLSRNEEFTELLQEFFHADRERSGLLVC